MVFLISCSAPKDKLSKEIPPVARTRPAKLLSCFFGLDNALPEKSAAIWIKAPGKDGMPIVFSHEINPETLSAEAFKITTRKGNEHFPVFVTFKPASEEFELRTVLAIGEFGNGDDDQPVKLEIVKDLMTRDGQNLKGQSISITPLENGPFISYAEYFSFDHDYPYLASGKVCDCPKDETRLVVRTVWAGGVRAMDGKEFGDSDLARFTVILKLEKDTLRIHPFHLADIDDNYNNIDLCFKEAGIPLIVEVESGTAIDPSDDPNQFTRMSVESRC